MILVKASKLVREYRIGNIVTRAIDGIDLEIQKGDFTAITGRSGSGKSTLLYQLSLLDKPSEGTVYVNGEDTSGYKSRDRSQKRLSLFGYVFQDYALVPELTALENVSLPLMMQGCRRRDSCAGAAEELLTRVGLENRLHNLPSQLSGGEQQRVSIARALINGPEVLFADEPTANLDTQTSEIIMNIFKDLHKQGLTIVMVTHELEYTKVSNNVIVLEDGKMVS